MNIAILGYGLQGQSAYKYWSGDGHDITICDQNTELELPNSAHARLGPAYMNDLDGFDVIVRSPSIHPSDIAAANTPSILSKVTTVTNEFFRISPTQKIIGVTGTKGKGTTSTLIAKMLEAAGERVHLAGNIGRPPLDLLPGDLRIDDWVVLELANFQLIDLHYSPKIAVCLMVVPEHLNWHADYEEYLTAKSQLFARQKSDDLAIYFADNTNSQRIASTGSAQKIPYYANPGAIVEHGTITVQGQQICRTDELKLLGAHNWQNACAAVTAVWQITQNVEAMRSVLTSFSGMEHRLELVREVHHIRYYDDSFGTTPETAIVAIEAFTEPKVVILGGSDKGASYDELANTVAGSKVRSVVLIGEQGGAIRKALESAGFKAIVNGGNSMPEIVAIAKKQAHHGDVVLLSTACASFDMFKDYKDRGQQFKSAVQSIS